MHSTTVSDSAGAARGSSGFGLFVAAIGVVFGDIGTSPLYALKETFAGPHPLALDQVHVLGVLSLIFWTVLSVVSIKYVAIIMRADNRGEGGSLALLALLHRAIADRPRLSVLIGALGLFAASLFYGDSIITPAISVLSAVEGLEIAAPGLGHYVEPITIAILILLFAIQRKGTATVGKLFGPIMTVWFVTLAVLGLRNIGAAPQVLLALSPHYAVQFMLADGTTAFLAMGSVALAVTGAEALYADMGHFGRMPIRLAWYLVVWPSLLLNYFGQGALLLTDPAAIESPFFRMVPEWATLPLVGLATCAAVIASQAVISGAFSVTRQAIQLGYLPRMSTIHTSEHEIGQIYVPFINWTLAILAIALVMGFHSSSNLASAYGVAVTGTMLITTVMISCLMFLHWGWRSWLIKLLVGIFVATDLALFLANATKIPHGGWFPLVIAAVAFTLLTTWKRGRTLLTARLERDALPVDQFLASCSDRITRVPGTAVFLTATGEGVPMALLHNLKHNRVLHQRVVLLTVRVEETPTIPREHRIESTALAPDFLRVVLHYGFMEDPDIPTALANATTAQLGFFYEPLSTSYFLSRETVIRSRQSSMPAWRERTFAFMSRSATSAMDFFHLPPNRVLELGGQVEI